MNITILYEDNHLIAVDKPAGLLVQGDRSGRENLLDTVRLFLKQKYNKPGNVFLGMVHRLDRQVSGVVLFAKTSKAASRLSRQFRDRSVIKIYLAQVHDNTTIPLADPEDMKWRLVTHYLAREKDLTVVTNAGNPEARESSIMYMPLAGRTGTRLLFVRLLSGRKHQIRAQLSSIGYSIVGDTLYGSTSDRHSDRIALHALYLGFMHPTSREQVIIKTPPPEHLLSGLGKAGFTVETVMNTLSRVVLDLSEGS